MEVRWSGALRATILLLTLISSECINPDENDRDFKFCGTWHHGSNPLSLTYDLTPGCEEILISANASFLSIRGQITAQCNTSGVVLLNPDGFGLRGQTSICLYWEPLLDHLWMEVGGQEHTLCWPSGLQGACCTDLSQKGNGPKGTYGIVNGSIRDDVASYKTLSAYTFFGDTINCKETFCDETSHQSTQVNKIEETVLRSQALGSVELPCALSYVVEMKKDFQGLDVTVPSPASKVPSVYISPSVNPKEKESKIIVTFFKNISIFKSRLAESQNDVIILEDVVGITVENEVITNLPEPIKIGFQHPVIPRTHSRKCVSWDTRKDPLKVTWREEGCWTENMGLHDTQCQCNHLTYFTVLVQLHRRPVRHLLALSVITSLGCAVSMISCVALFIYLSKKRRANEQSSPVHMGLSISLFSLYLVFFFTGTLANIGEGQLCPWVGAALHYALLSSFAWMVTEVFHTFWLIHKVFSPTPKHYVWNLIGFGLPVLPVVILASLGTIYGIKELVPSDDINNPYRMCWMKDTPEAMLAHYFTNLTVLAVLVFSGLVMLFQVYRQIRTREEWRQNRVAFLSIWGLSCLFGSSWGLTFLDFGPLSDTVHFLFCILNSFQGFFMMLRFYLLDWMRRQACGSALGSSSTGSTRQHMLQPQEKI